MPEKLSDRIVCTPIGGVVKVQVRHHGSEATKANYGNVERVKQGTETFFAWHVASGQGGTAGRYMAAVIAAAKIIDRGES